MLTSLIQKGLIVAYTQDRAGLWDLGGEGKILFFIKHPGIGVPEWRATQAEQVKGASERERQAALKECGVGCSACAGCVWEPWALALGSLH